MADYLGADCFAVAVMPFGTQVRLSKQDREAVEKHLNFARNLHIETRVLEGDDAAETIVDFARRNQITQIVLSRHDHSLVESPASELTSFCGSFRKQRIFG